MFRYLFSHILIWSHYSRVRYKCWRIPKTIEIFSILGLELRYPDCCHSSFHISLQIWLNEAFNHQCTITRHHGPLAEKVSCELNIPWLNTVATPISYVACALNWNLWKHVGSWGVRLMTNDWSTYMVDQFLLKFMIKWIEIVETDWHWWTQ